MKWPLLKLQSGMWLVDPRKESTEKVGVFSIVRFKRNCSQVSLVTGDKGDIQQAEKKSVMVSPILYSSGYERLFRKKKSP